jgi:CheY-like chemotaxis protein
VLLDHVMPGTSGFEVLATLLGIDPALSVILISSDNQPGDMTKAKALGASAYITKPVRRAKLLSMISRTLQENRERKTLSSGDLVQAVENNRIAASAIKVLIADDSEDNRFLMSAYLNNRPYELTFVENGREALETFASREFDLVLMDIQMPIMDGLAATVSIRALEWQRATGSIPIVALSANARREDAELSQAAGCNAHLSKPISKEKLIAAIESFRRARETVEAGVENVAGQAKHTIEIPEGFEALSRNYIASRRKEISRMIELPLGEGLNELRVFGHNMKGLAVSFGFPELAKLGAAIEEAAKVSGTAQLADHLAKVNEYVEYAWIYMERGA